MGENKRIDLNIIFAFVMGALAGALIGFLLAPVKAGVNMKNTISIGSNNGCNNIIREK